MKEGLAKFFGVDINHFYDRDLKTQQIPGFDITPREAMIKVGTDLMRNHVDDAIWIKSTINSIKNASCDIIIVTDVRYQNEAKAIRDLGGVLFYIDRPNNPNADLAASHSSENDINDENCLSLGFVKVFNDSTLEKFHSTAKLIVDDIALSFMDERPFLLTPRADLFMLPTVNTQISRESCHNFDER